MVKLIENAPLAGRNTFGIEASCRIWCEFSGKEDLQEIFSSSIVGDSPWSVISKGSNILFTSDYPGVLLHPIQRDIKIVSEHGQNVSVHAGAGVDWDDFTAFCAHNGLWGAENLTLIPGFVGASPVQNIGAYGVEVKDIIESVEMFCVDSGIMLTLFKEHCGFGYRNSVFKTELKGKVVITAVNFVLSREPRPRLGYGDLNDMVNELGGPSLQNIRRAVTHIRESKLPDPKIMGNAGSFFKNPVVSHDLARELKNEYESMPLYPAQQDGYSKLAAGWLIDRCGWKGRRVGNVGVHDKQALVIVNYGGATGKEVLEFARTVCADVRKKFGIELEMEVNIL